MFIKEILVEDYKTAAAAFLQAGADRTAVDKTIDLYRNLVNRNQVQGNERQIDWWVKQGWNQFNTFVQQKSIQATKTQVKRKRAVGKSIILKEDNNWLIVVPLDHDASCFHGRNTNWCVSRPTAHHFDEYFLDVGVVLIFCINKKTGSKWAIASREDHIDAAEYFDQDDHAISSQQFRNQTGLDPRSVIALVNHSDNRIFTVRKLRRTAIQQLYNSMNDWLRTARHRSAEFEQQLIAAKVPEFSYYYIMFVGDRYGPQSWPEAIVNAAVRYEPDDLDRYWQQRSQEMGGIAYNADLSPLQYIQHPTPAQQIAALQVSPSALQFIQHPSERLLLAVAERNAGILRYIKQPSEAVQLAAVKHDGDSIRYLRNKHPSEAVQLAAVKNDGYAIEHIDNPSEAVQLAAVDQTPEAVLVIGNPSDAALLAAIKYDPWILNDKYLAKHNLSPAVRAAIQQAQTEDAD